MQKYDVGRTKLKLALLKFPPVREALFFIFQKKVYKEIIDKRIKKLINGKIKLTDSKIKNLVVSVTSFPERINEVKYMLFSVLSQTLRPEKIVLWLAESQFSLREKDLTWELLALCKYDIEIRWYAEDIRSYKKLIPSLEYLPEKCIVTADDDIYYRRDWLEKLWRTHLNHPDDIICHVANKVLFDKDRNLLSYKQWNVNVISSDASSFYFPVGVGGVLYRKRFLLSDVTNKHLFLSHAPYADDIWFYFMGILNNAKIRVVEKPYTSMKFVNPYREYNLIKQFKLADLNFENDKNDDQFKSVFDYYHNLFGDLFYEYFDE